MLYRTRNILTKRRFGIHVATAALIILSMSLLPQSVFAVSYSVNTQGDCAPGYPRGEGWLNWSGGGFWTDGKTHSKMYFWNVNTWSFLTEAVGTDRGGVGLARAPVSKSYRRGSYKIDSFHTSDFFSGTKNTDHGWTCS